MENLKDTFYFFDQNSDGVISRAELIELVDVLLGEKGIGKSARILKEFDKNHDGVIDFKEFKILIEEKLDLKFSDLNA